MGKLSSYLYFSGRHPLRGKTDRRKRKKLHHDRLMSKVIDTLTKNNNNNNNNKIKLLSLALLLQDVAVLAS